MIIDPDFLDHWRTRMVVDALNDEMAPMYIMRLWAHCQARKSDRHAMPPAGLKAQCRAPHDAAAFEQALTDAGFVQREGAEVVVIGWADANASLIAAWDNGAKGGRPPKKPKQNPAGTQEEPSGNPALTQPEPAANPSETQAKPIREDKSREEVIPPPNGGERAKPRPTRKCPESFEVSSELKTWAAEHAPGIDLARETATFRDHTFKTAISDWPGAWRNWIRRAGQFGQQARASPQRPSRHSGFEHMDYTAGVNADGTLA